MTWDLWHTVEWLWEYSLPWLLYYHMISAWTMATLIAYRGKRSR